MRSVVNSALPPPVPAIISESTIIKAKTLSMNRVKNIMGRRSCFVYATVQVW